MVCTSWRLVVSVSIGIRALLIYMYGVSGCAVLSLLLWTDVERMISGKHGTLGVLLLVQAECCVLRRVCVALCCKQWGITHIPSWDRECHVSTLLALRMYMYICDVILKSGWALIGKEHLHSCTVHTLYVALSPCSPLCLSHGGQRLHN